ncbi:MULTISPECIES: ParB/RepB/Spo0J family partition protein [unclassified Pseudonocardia]|uniref:ParB/RepB/Spo0J family partition protein n=1 Tax=unclassified Pseudonocardia TaxID=2619320 RepID=UPI0001FFE63A|nr:ParB/RepB/Spo0J family partition protein [Pseudonocardia sp. Ae707_Ps1]OLM21491.1 Chromosome (plasmid) partitioning protein ParB [Pseudonocardia sp. Ae707_Ps1]
MAERKGGLGRGLAALIPTGPAEGGEQPGSNGAGAPLHRPAPAVQREDAETETPVVDGGAEYREIPLKRIVPNPKQPRTQFDDEQLGELEHSIREFGLLQPIVVRRSGRDYELIMGERRWRAAQRAGLDTLPAIVRHTADDVMLRDALLENIHRVQLNPLEEAAAYEQLLGEFGVTHSELADRLGRSRPVVTNMIRLLKLPVTVQRRVAAGVLSAGHARALLGLEDAGRQEDLATRIVAEGLSVRATEEAVVLARQDGPPRERRARKRGEQRPEFTERADRLSDRFDTRVKVEMGQRKGRIVVEFGSVEDLDRITGMMGIREQD